MSGKDDLSGNKTLIPTDGITESNPGIGPDGKKITGAKTTKFALFTENWIQMQTFIATALKLPISNGDFDTKYGVFDAKHKAAVQNCITAFTSLHGSAQEFGNPAVLMKELASLQGGEKPPSIYGEIVWVANQIASAAQSFEFTYSSLKEVLVDSMSKEERKAALTEILTGKGGLRDKAVEMEAKATTLRNRLMAFSTKIGENQKSIDLYANVSGEVYRDAVAKAGELGTQLTELKVKIKEHNDAYIGYAAGAGGGAALIFIFTFGLGWPIALAYGVGMGVGGAEMARQAMENCKTLFEEAKGDQQQKLVLQADLEGLNTRIGDIRTHVDAVCDGLKGIIGVWNNQVAALDTIVKDTDLDKLLTFPALNLKLGILAAQGKWKQIATDTFEFTANAFVEYREQKAA